MSALLDALFQQGAFEELDVVLARSLLRLAAETDDEVLLAAALASRAVHEGHVCFDLHKPVALENAELRAQLPSPAAFIAKLNASTLVSRAHEASADRPLVLDEQGRLYLARYFDHERSIAGLLRDWAKGTRPEPARSELIEALFPPSPEQVRDKQREAVERARTRKLSVIVGGPGTGKTSTVVKLLAVLIDDTLAQGHTPPRTLLLAPTGKAAQRLSESIESARDKLPIAAELRAMIHSEAMTVHRALSPIGGSLTRFRFGPEQPLVCDVLLVDEASMVDLALMRRLLAAVPEHARVILLGDPDQLASVEAGGVLGDLCVAAERDGSPLRGCLSRLTESHRYPSGSGIAALAEAVLQGDEARALEVLRDKAYEDVALAPDVMRDAGRKALALEAGRAYAPLASKPLAEKLATLSRFRVLCAHQRGPDGARSLNDKLASVVHGAHKPLGEAYTGRPILVTQNDYGTLLFNGDVGVIAREQGKRDLKAYFLTGSGTRAIALGRLPQHESVYAMTVHKSQGSEHEHVAIVLPETPSPVVTRELLYTAITRARRFVTLYASEAVFRAAVRTRTVRASGLSDALNR